MAKKLGYFVLGLLLATLSFLTLAHFQAKGDGRRADEQRVISTARAIAWVVRQETNREDDAAEGLAQRFLDRAKTDVPGLETALVLKGTQFVAHTITEKVGQRLDRESLEDKNLYDTAKELKATVRKNIEERERNPELKRDAYQEYTIARVHGEGTIRVLFPAKVDGDYYALAAVDMRSAPQPPSFPLLVALLALGALVAFALVAFKGEGLLLHLLGSAVMVAVLGLQAHALVDWRDANRHEAAEQNAQVLGQLAKAGLVYAATDPAEDLAGELSLDPKGRPTGGIRAVVSSTVGWSKPADALTFSSSGYLTAYGQDYFETARSLDAKYLIQWAVLFGIFALLLFNLGIAGLLFRAWRAAVDHRFAYGYMAPAMSGMLVLVFVPVVFGIVLGFMRRDYNEWTFAALDNYLKILSDFNITEPTNFYFTLTVTVLWTVSNVVFHVSIGLFLALLLNDQLLKARGLFRVLLIIPWAIPNYITALIWKGMFHKQFGAINFFLEAFGFEPIAWFQSFWPAFFTNWSTNVWLGFPFMMVISLGALQSIPTDLYEAAIVDGASRWQRFRNITLPLLMPALVPAVIVGTVWTFNMFNIIYLVSGGAPNGATDILITEAFRWAFERDRYGYAAAYSTVIFVILLAFTLVTNKFTGATKGAFE